MHTVHGDPTPENVDVNVSPEDPRSTEDEAEERRTQVQLLRNRRYSQRQIARVLHVNQATISRDLKEIAANRREMFGPNAKLQLEDEIGSALDVWSEIEMRALRPAPATVAALRC